MSEEIIEKIGQRIFDMGLAAPAIFLLEMHKPFVGIFSVVAQGFSPILLLFLGKQLAEELKEVSLTRDSLEALIVAIERRTVNAV